MGQVWDHQRSGVSRSLNDIGFIYSPRHSICSLYNKEEEFRAWLVEECKINPETISKDQTKKQFARFVEDYNTGLPVPLVCI